jgi:GT2 family glycosyltransferase
VDKSKSYQHDVSVIIINWNTCDDLEVCISSLLETSENLTTEITVVDNASEDSSVLMVRSKFPTVNLIQNSSNLGFAAAVNQGIQKSKGTFLLILNSDIIAERGVLKTLVETLKLNPNVGAVAPRLLNIDRTVQTGYFRKYPSLFQILFYYTFLSRFTERNPKLFQRYMEDVPDMQNSNLEVPQIPGGCMMVSREVVKKVGLMDENYFLFFEDVDWCYRMRMNNYRLLKINTVSMVHLGGRSFIKGDNYWLHGRFMLSLNLFVDKHYSRWFRILTKMITLGDSIIVLTLRRIQLFSKRAHSNQSWQHSYSRHRYFVYLFADQYFPTFLGKFISKVFKPEGRK